MMTTLYDVLEIDINAEPDEIKTAFKKKVKQHHPDKGGDPEKFIKVQHAYEILSDVNKRKFYDDTGYTEDDQEFQIILKTIEEYFFHFLNKNQPIYIEDIHLLHRENIIVLKDEIKKSEKKQKTLLKFKANLIQTKGNIDFAGGALNGMLNAGKTSLQVQKEQLRLANRVMDILKWYKSKNKKKGGPGYNYNTTMNFFDSIRW